MSRLVIISFIILTSCATIVRTARFTTTQGVTIHDKTDLALTKQEVSDFIEKGIRELGITIKAVNVHLFPNLIVIPQQGTDEAIVADGVRSRDNTTILVSVFSRCLAASGLLHELAHTTRGDFHDDEFHEKLKQYEKEQMKQCSPADLEADVQARKAKKWELVHLPSLQKN